LLIVFAVLISSCRANISRNSNGSTDVETTVTQQEIQDAITAGIADPLIKEITVSLQSGYILVSGTRERLNDSSKMDTLSFRLDLGVSNGQLASAISNTKFDGFTVEQNRIDNWNRTIANRITRLAQKSTRSTLKSVSVTTGTVTMTWNVTK
jgi:hypothetical protein